MYTIYTPVVAKGLIAHLASKFDLTDRILIMTTHPIERCW